MPPFRKSKNLADGSDVDYIIPDTPKPVDAACLLTITGSAKGHPPVTIACFGSNPKVAVNALKKLLTHGKLEVTV